MVKMISMGSAGRPNNSQILQQGRQTPEQWAQQLLARPADTWCILDTETTGFTGIDEVIELSIIDGAGQVLIDKKRFKPKCEIHPGAQEVHRITMEDLQDEVDFGDFAEELDAILHKRRIVIYNSNFDIRMLTQTAVIHSALSRVIFDDVTCAMIRYAEFVGERKRSGEYRLQKLPGGDHTSLGDCRAVMDLINRMAGLG
jgi:DNA polymerase III subunit epsilon